MKYQYTVLDAVSFVSRIAEDEYDTRSKGLIAWGGLSPDYGEGTKAGYWCYVCFDAKHLVTQIIVYEDYLFWPGNPYKNPHDLIYLVQGWCAYHDVKFSLNEPLDEAQEPEQCLNALGASYSNI